MEEALLLRVLAPARRAPREHGARDASRARRDDRALWRRLADPDLLRGGRNAVLRRALLVPRDDHPARGSLGRTAPERLLLARGPGSLEPERSGPGLVRS